MNSVWRIFDIKFTHCPIDVFLSLKSYFNFLKHLLQIKRTISNAIFCMRKYSENE